MGPEPIVKNGVITPFINGLEDIGFTGGYFTPINKWSDISVVPLLKNWWQKPTLQDDIPSLVCRIPMIDGAWIPRPTTWEVLKNPVNDGN